MALSESPWQRKLTLCALYVAQGVPWGFMLITLPAYLAYEYNVSVNDIGKLTAIILVPWSFKLIWAPVMDTFTIRSMGRRRPWIIGAELLMALTLLGFVGMGNPSEKLSFILAMYFLHNCFASLQDVCTDALAVDILPFAEQGRMNGLMWGSKLVGKGIGAWVLSLVLETGGLEACVAVQILVLLAIMVIPIVFLERPGEKRFPWSAGEAHAEAAVNVRSPGEVFREFLKAFSLTTMLVYIVFTLTKLIGYGINEVVTKTLYTQELDPQWTAVEYSTASGLYAIGFIIVGAVLGGYLSDRFGRRVILTVGFGGYGLAALLFAASPGLWNERWFTMSYLLSFEALNAIASVGFLSMAMRISWTTAAATVFTTYMTLSNVSHIVGNWLAGPVFEMLRLAQSGTPDEIRTYELTFWLVGFVTLLPLLLLYYVRPEEVDLARRDDEARDDTA